MKFLRARNLDPTEAKDMFISTLRWRESFNVDAAMNERFPDEVFGQLGKVYGRDKQGHPVTYNLYGANKDLNAVFGDVRRFLRWRVAFMEKNIALLDFETTDQMVQIHDYEGALVCLTAQTTLRMLRRKHRVSFRVIIPSSCPGSSLSMYPPSWLESSGCSSLSSQQSLSQR